MRRRGRPVLGAFSGFFLGLLLGVDLLLFGVVALDSALLLVLPVLGLVVGIVLPLVMRRRARPPAEGTPAAPGGYVPPPPPDAAQETPEEPAPST